MAKASVEQRLSRPVVQDGSGTGTTCRCRSEELRVVVFKCRDEVPEDSTPCIPTVGEEIARGVWIWISVCECTSHGSSRS